MPDDDDWIEAARKGIEEAHKCMQEEWRRSPDRTDWVDLKVATDRIKEYAGLSTGAAQVVLHRACSSGEVRSRGWTSHGYWDRGHIDIPLTEADWVGAGIDPTRTSLYKDAGRLIIPRVSIHLPDLEWWLRSSTGAAPGHPAVQAQRDNGVNAGISRGKRGRKSKGGKELYLAEFELLYGNKSDLPPVPEIADQLAEWLRLEHPEIKEPPLQTIKNRLWEKLHDYKAARG